MHPTPNLTESSGSPKSWKLISSLFKYHIWGREGGPSPKVTQVSGPPQGLEPLVVLPPEGLHNSGAPPGRSRPESLLLPASEGRPGGRTEEVSAAGKNANGRGAPAWDSGDSRAGGWGSGARDASLHRGAGGRTAARRL